MNLPNKLTILRAAMVPFFVFFLLTDLCGPIGDWIALFIFIAASVTDLLDGKIARKYDLVTNFGKFMDPLADKLLVSSALICLVFLNRLNPWIAIIIIAREFIISGFRLIASDQGIVIAASWWGKLKTVFQIVMIGFLIGSPTLIDFLAGFYTAVPALVYVSGFFYWTSKILVWVALFLTVVSLVDYILKNRKVLDSSEN